MILMCLILDEPTSGLDPNQVHGVRDLILELAKTKTILVVDSYPAGGSCGLQSSGDGE
jgi:ABC-type multidrug transport system ATPase subunit